MRQCRPKLILARTTSRTQSNHFLFVVDFPCGCVCVWGRIISSGQQLSLRQHICNSAAIFKICTDTYLTRNYTYRRVCCVCVLVLHGSRTPSNLRSHATLCAQIVDPMMLATCHYIKWHPANRYCWLGCNSAKLIYDNRKIDYYKPLLG